jgi:hypothetical protein
LLNCNNFLLLFHVYYIYTFLIKFCTCLLMSIFQPIQSKWKINHIYVYICVYVVCCNFIRKKCEWKNSTKQDHRAIIPIWTWHAPVKNLNLTLFPEWPTSSMSTYQHMILIVNRLFLLHSCPVSFKIFSCLKFENGWF